LPLGQFLLSQKPRQTETIKQESSEKEFSQPVPPGPDDSLPNKGENVGEEGEFAPVTPMTRREPIIDLSSVETSVSHVTGEFKERLATYALDSPGRARSIDASLTPAPEVSIPQNSPSERRRRASDLSQQESEEDEEENTHPLPRARRTTKRPITMVVSSSQMDTLLGGAPSKKSKTAETAPKKTDFQTSLRNRFLRKANDGEMVSRQAAMIEELELLTPEQVEKPLAVVETQEEELEVEEDLKDVEMEDSTTGADDSEDKVREENIEQSLEEEQVQAHIVEESTKSSPSKPGKLHRNLSKPRLKNAVHNLRITTSLSISALTSQHSLLIHPLTSSPAKSHQRNTPSQPKKPKKGCR